MRGLVILLLAVGAVCADDFDDVRDMVMNKMKDAAKIAVSMEKADNMMSKTLEDVDSEERRLLDISAGASAGPLNVGGSVGGGLSGADAVVHASLANLEGGASVGAGLTSGLQGGAHLGPLAANANLGLQGAGAGVNLGPLGVGASAGFNNHGFNFGGGLGLGGYAGMGTPQYFQSTYGARPWYHPLSILGVRGLMPPPTNHDSRFSLPSLDFNLGAGVGSFNTGANVGFNLQDGLHGGAHLGNLVSANANLGLTSAGVGANVGSFNTGANVGLNLQNGLHGGAHLGNLASANANLGLTSAGVGANVGHYGGGLNAGLTSGLGFMGGLGHGNYAAYGTPQYLNQQYGSGWFGRSPAPIHPVYGLLPFGHPQRQ